MTNRIEVSKEKSLENTYHIYRTFTLPSGPELEILRGVSLIVPLLSYFTAHPIKLTCITHNIFRNEYHLLVTLTKSIA